jgi:hypothetical protein
MIILDIETGPLPEEKLIVPEFRAPANYKDPAKIEAYLAEAKRDWMGNLALSAVTGQILAVGLIEQNGDMRVMTADESEMIRDVWTLWGATPQKEFVGFNILGFDIPFLCQRSWILGIPVPRDVLEFRSRRIIDLMLVWSVNQREKVSLDTVCQVLKIGKKTGHGKDFAALFESDRESAIRYVETDLCLTAQLARRIL